MRRGSQAFEDLRHQAGAVVTRVDVVVDGDVVAGTEERTPSRKFALRDGRLTHNVATQVVTTGTMQLGLHDRHLVPLDGFGPLAPMARARLVVSTGFILNGQLETMPAAVLTISDAEFKSLGDGDTIVDLEVEDLSKDLARSGFLAPFSIHAGTNVVQEIADQVGAVYPGLVLNADQSGVSTATLEVDENKSRLDIINDLAGMINTKFMFTADGTPTLVSRSLGWADTPVDQYDTNDPRIDVSGGLNGLCRRLTIDGVHNAFKVVAESTREPDENGDTPEPIVAAAFADNQPSPAYYDQAMFDAGASGLFPETIVTQVIQSTKAVEQFARSSANTLALQPEFVTGSIRPSPGLELMDTIALNHDPIGLQGLFTIGSMTRPLGEGWMTFGANERRLGAAL